MAKILKNDRVVNAFTAQAELRRRRTSERVAAAFHESAHAIVAEAFGFPVAYVNIVPGDGFVGHCQLAITPDGGAFPIFGTPRALCYLAQTLAGAAAEYIRGTLPLDSLPASDVDCLIPVLLPMAANAGKPPREFYERIMSMTLELVSSPRMWSAIATLAELLLDRDSVDGEAVRQVLREEGIAVCTENEQIALAMMLAGKTSLRAR